MTQLNALVLGATGLTGKGLTSLLCHHENIGQVRCLARSNKAPNLKNLKWVKADFQHLAKYKDHFKTDIVYCCIGTTIKKAGSKRSFYLTDFSLVLKAARLAAKQGAKHFIVISSLGANADALTFYNRVKGKMEKALVATFINSETKLTIVRPSLLLGKRPEQRFAEGIAGWFFKLTNPMWKGFLEKYKPIEAQDLAKAMVEIGMTKADFLPTIVENKQLHEIAAAS